MTEKIVIEGHEFEGIKIPTEKASILMIKCDRGFLGCGYFNADTADKLGECMALVTGVKTLEDMFTAKVIRASHQAATLGILEGMSGQDALLKMIRSS